MKPSLFETNIITVFVFRRRVEQMKEEEEEEGQEACLVVEVYLHYFYLLYTQM